MSRKDYERIAAELRRSRPDYIGPDVIVTDETAYQRRVGFALAVEAITRALADENPRFDSHKFYAAIYR